MKTLYRWTLALSLGWYAAQGQGAERLGGISDETAPPAAESQSAKDADGGITYRVICSPEGEMLPECGQPPVKDSFAAEQPQAAVPDAPASATDESLEQPDDNQAPASKPASVADSARGKKGAARKKPAKKVAKKPGKDKQRSKKRQRH